MLLIDDKTTVYSRQKLSVQQGSHLLPRCRVISLLNGNQTRKLYFMAILVIFFFQNISFLFFFFFFWGGGVSYMPQMHTDRHIIIISEGCIGCIMNCASTILTTRRTLETLTKWTTLDNKCHMWYIVIYRYSCYI